MNIPEKTEASAMASKTSDPFVEVGEVEPKYLMHALDKAFEAIRAEQSYIRGTMSAETFYSIAYEFLECGRPFDEGGDELCTHCIAKSIMTSLEKENEKFCSEVCIDV